MIFFLVSRVGTEFCGSELREGQQEQGLNHSRCFLFQEVIRNLVKRYVAAMIRTSKTNESLTEENFKVIHYSLMIICYTHSSSSLQSSHLLVRMICNLCGNRIYWSWDLDHVHVGVFSRKYY